MEKKYFSLGSGDNNKLVRVIQIVFGIVCIVVAVFWMMFNARSIKADGTLWITIVFLCGFGFYQVWTGLGRASRFIEFNQERILLKKNIFLPVVEIPAEQIQKIEIYPMNLIFTLKSNKRLLLRFGASYQETNENIKDEILNFADSMSINIEFKEEKL